MEVVEVRNARIQLSRLMDRVAAGEEIGLSKRGKLLAKLVPLRPVGRRPGRLKGKIRIAADFDAPLTPDVAKAFGQLQVWNTV